MVDFPLPEPPTTAIRWPGVASNDTPRRIGRLVGEPDPLEPHLSPQAGRGDGVGGVLDVGLVPEDVEDPLAGRHGLGQPPGVLGEVTHRLEGVLLVGEEDDQRAGSEVAAEHEPRAEVQDHGRRDGDEQVHGALELSRQSGALDALLEALLVVAGEGVEEGPLQ